jgi:inorganic triphosphatase YgiF
MPAEVEARFTAASDAVLDELASVPALGSARLGPPATTDEVDRYLDTADGRLEAALWACRLRRRDGTTRVSLKGPAEITEAAWHHRRAEVEGPATDAVDPAAWPPSEARDLLLSMTGGLPLAERFTLAQRRTERAVHLDERAVATLSLDRVEVRRAGRTHGALRIVELELVDEDALDAGPFADLADALGARDDLGPDPHTKLEHALEILGDR